jgi:molybdenum cofactor guanylyltransferase
MNNTDTAIILAGGKSSRMGFDKQFIEINGITITEYIIDLLRPIFKSIILVTNRPECYHRDSVIIVEDYYKDFGPLSGMHTGLMKSESQYNYIIACDMPYVNIAYIDYMKKLLEKDHYSKSAVITKFGDWIEPFNAFYSKALIPQIEENITQKKRKISSALCSSQVLYIEEKTARGFSPDWSMFTNLNSVDDLERMALLRAGE